MEKKLMGWKTKGMNRDLSVSAFNNEFSFENMNLRLSTNENNTTMSWVNEKGTSYLSVDIIVTPWDINSEHVNYILGNPIGTAVLNHQLILFTTDPGQLVPQLAPGQSPNEKRDYIYLLKYSDPNKTKLEGKILYQGNLNFNSNYPLETLVSYEAEHIQKVYWTDGYNQPRMINVAASDSKLEKWNSTEDNSIDTFFDFVPTFDNGEEVNIVQYATLGGLFAPGVIQYAFTYINKYGQESNIVYVSPLYYLSHSDRGASPEGVGNERVSSSFKIEISNIDQNFDYVRLYSIQRTSLDLEPIVKHLDDLPVSGTSNAELFSRELVYSNNSALTLPLDSKGKILTVEVRNGEGTVTITPLENTDSYSNSGIFVFVGKQEGSEFQEILTLQELINKVYQVNSEYSEARFSGNYYSGVRLSSDIVSYFDDIVSRNRYDSWWLKINEDLFTREQLENVSLVYNYIDQNWYLTNTTVSEGETREVPTGEHYITYIDNGTTGSLMDPTELLFVGGKEISALTMSDKDHTLFLGNIEQKNVLVTDIQDYFLNSENKPSISFTNTNVNKRIPLKKSTGIYTYTHSLGLGNRRNITSFKYGEEYRFGFQLQKHTGEWLDPIYIGDATNTNTYPSQTDNYLQFVSAQANIPVGGETGIDVTLYKKIRPVIVYPTIGDRNILCQGVLNPTVFNSLDRIDKSPFAQASWYFRPIITNSSDIPVDDDTEITGTTSVQHQTTPYSEQPSNLEPAENMYVLVATVTDESLNNITKLGYLSANDSYWEDKTDTNGNIYHVSDHVNTFEYNIYGYIILEENSQAGTKKCAFLCSSQFATPEVDVRREWDDGTIEITSHVYEGLTNPVVSGFSKFPFYVGENMKTFRGLLYYVGEDGAPAYSFYFHVNEEDSTKTYYKITFINKEGVVYRNVEGSSVEYRHYSALPNYNNKNPKSVEIQGTTTLYDSPYSEYDETKIKSNTQFFIDQSIVTLNSPDLEFDTEVQNCDLEGFKLRIIGAVPITSSASGHYISSSAMIELQHNLTGNNTKLCGIGDLKRNVWNNVPSSGKWHLVAERLWNDAVIDTWKDSEKGNIIDKDDKIKSLINTVDFFIYPWHRNGSLNNDWRKEDEAFSWIKIKKESNLLVSNKTIFANSSINYSNISAQIHLQENEYIENIRLHSQINTSSEINYYSNIDKILYNEDGYGIVGAMLPQRTYTTPVSMKYKSGTHAVIALNSTDNTYIPILPKYGSANVYDNPELDSYNTFWGDTSIKFIQSQMSGITLDSNVSFLWLGELYRESVSDTKFGGNSKEAIRNNKWLVAGDAIDMTEMDSDTNTITLNWTEGDTYYQRYDCLKTYAFTPEDTNQIIEILSFMCETHVNIDGRYDKNRGQLDNTDMHPTIFNKLNPVYSQKDNFFTSRQLDTEDVKDLKYPNQIYYSKTKNSGSDVDLWTNVTLASVLEMDGDKGQITSLNRLNDAIIVFQDSGISQVLYNENMQMSTTQGVPVEIANSGKVTGKRYFSDTVGCSNKWSVVQTPLGIYFMDSNNKNIYLFNGQLQNISGSFGFNVWAKSNIPSSEIKWTPTAFANFTGFYDKQNQDVLFVNKDTALAYSEKLGAFTSFYNYENSPYLCSLDDTGIWLKWSRGVDITTGEEHSNTHLWKHNAGEYCKFFGYNKQYWMTLVGNHEPLRDKIFTNLEFRASVDGDGEYNDRQRYVPYLPFDSLEVWNEYQHGDTELKTKWGHRITKHHDGDNSTLARNYRIWRCDIPRDNTHRMDRMRNPWVYLKLMKKAEGSPKRTEIHDILMTYFV